MSIRIVTCTTALIVTALSVALSGRPPEHAATVTLDVPARSDATPSVAAHGTFVAVAWGAGADGKTDVFAAVSRDGGGTFGAPVRVNQELGEGRLGGELPPRVALVPGAAGVEPSVVVLWTARGVATTIKSARSRDGGRTFEAPVTLQADGAAGDRGWPALAVDAAGVAHAIWLDHRGLAARRAMAGADSRAARPATGGGHAHGAGAAGATVDGSVAARGSGLVHASWGATVNAELEVTTGVCYCCKTALAAAPDGTLYAAWRHVYAGDLRDMAMAVSRDGGRSFSSPARVSEDGWAINGCPDDGPAVVVDATGTAHIAWPTVVGGSEPEGAIFYATTRDGQRFTPRVRVPTLGSPKPMHPQLAIAANGRVVVAWDELIDGRRVAAMREVIAAPTGPATYGAVVTLAPSGRATHPVLAAVPGGLLAAWSTGGEVSRVETRLVAIP